MSPHFSWLCLDAPEPNPIYHQCHIQTYDDNDDNDDNDETDDKDDKDDNCIVNGDESYNDGDVGVLRHVCCICLCYLCVQYIVHCSVQLLRF